MKITALAGGVGGAKLAQGLSEILPPGELTIIVNTGDDFEFFGLYICPDLDTVTYTLAGFAHPVTGWGIKEDTFNTFKRLQQNGSPTWFKLGDRDLATHLERTRLLDAGKSLTEVTGHFNNIWQLKHPVLPMSNNQVPTYIETVDKGLLTFQEYFVKYRFEPVVKEIIFKNMDQAQASTEVLAALQESDAIVICPSNPLVSIDPILALPDIRNSLKKKFVVAVSPIIGGKAVKGPLTKMYLELGIEPNPASVASHYADFLDCIYLDNQDENYGIVIQQSGIIFQATNILMSDLESRTRLAEDIIKFLEKT
jgi:LPPG:FO 2-phospho-L-lactate transferase